VVGLLAFTVVRYIIDLNMDLNVGLFSPKNCKSVVLTKTCQAKTSTSYRGVSRSSFTNGAVCARFDGSFSPKTAKK
jgi:subtilisin-like proprotein convertase family protein